MDGLHGDDGDVSVVIVAYRSPDALAACLRSFEVHRPARVREVIVIDNSTDGSVKPLEQRFPWIDYVANTENIHFRAANNQGARRARGRYLFLLNPDTRLTDSSSIANLAEILDRHPDVGFVGPKVQGERGTLAPQGEPISGLGGLFAMKTRLNSIWPANPLGPTHARRRLPPESSGPIPTATAAALLCRRDEFLAVGGFDERARAYWEEHELARKLRARKLHGYYRVDAVVFHSWRKGGTHLVQPRASRDEFERALKVYYGQAYGVPGRILVAVLDAPSTAARIVRRAISRQAVSASPLPPPTSPERPAGGSSPARRRWPR